MSITERLNTTRSLLLFYTIILLLLVGSIIFVSGRTNLAFSREYNAASDLFNETNRFYTVMKEARGDAQNYFYTMLGENLYIYYERMKNAAEILDGIIAKMDDEYLRFRFEILRNMMESCREQFDRVATANVRPFYSADYARLFVYYDVTGATQGDYYNYLVQYNEERQKTLAVFWRRMNMITWIAVGLLIFAAALFSIIASWWIMRQLKSQAESNVRKMLLESENLNLKKTELMVKSELKMLQAQMNPHFLFNTLSMISQLATMGRSDEAAELIDITAYLLRYSMDKSNRMSTLREEIECVRSYLHIQRLRFGDRITFELNVEEALPNIMLPGMILQPLIENAVLHGVDGVLKGAVVSVSSERRENSLRLSVEDNGRGMSGERLEEIMSSDSFDGDEHVHIGLLNVKKRIEMLFGESASFHIESTEDVGTLVTITIDIASNAGEGNV